MKKLLLVVIALLSVVFMVLSCNDTPVNTESQPTTTDTDTPASSDSDSDTDTDTDTDTDSDSDDSTDSEDGENMNDVLGPDWTTPQK